MSGIYIHIPYCHSKCYYCDFFSTPNARGLEKYVASLNQEFCLRQSEIQLPPNTIYIGGGTPSILPIELLQSIIDFLPTESVEEFTIEVNPEDVTEQFAEFLASSAINRVSMGVQTFIDDELKSIGRRHSAADAITAVHRLRSAGIRNLSLDLIFGLPGQKLPDWEYNLNMLLSLTPEHLSTYSLMYEPGTKLWAMRENGKIKEVTDESSEKMYQLLCEKTATLGYEHYEISNFCKPGYHSRHNSSYWNLTPYLGLGVSAHSFDGAIRRYNPSNIKKYIECVRDFFVTEKTSLTERINEYLLIRLRTAEGINLEEYKNLFGISECDRLINASCHHVSIRKMILTPTHLRINPNYWLISDSILVDLFAED